MPNLGILALDGAGCEGVVGFGLAQRWLVGGSLLELLVYRVAQRLRVWGYGGFDGSTLTFWLAAFVVLRGGGDALYFSLPARQ